MTSVPLGFWPDNLSSLAWVGVLLTLLLGSFLDINTNIVVNIIIFMFVIFVADALILGPLYYLMTRR